MSKKLMTAKEFATEMGLEIYQIYYLLKKYNIKKRMQKRQGGAVIYYYDPDDLKNEIRCINNIINNDKYLTFNEICEIINLPKEIVRYRLQKFNLKHEYEFGAKYYYDKSIVEILTAYEYKGKKSFKSIRNIRFNKKLCLYCFKYHADNYFPEGKSSVCYECRDKISESVKANFIKLYHKNILETNNE